MNRPPIADALLARKGRGKEAKLSYNGNLLTENRNGLIIATEVLPATGTAERDAAILMLEQIPGGHRVTVGADKAYDTRDFVQECRNMKVTPHVAQNTKRSGGSAIDERTTRHEGYDDQPAEAEAHRRVLRMAEDDRPDAEGAASGNRQGRLGVHICRGGVQPGADAQTAGQSGWCSMSQGRSVPARGQSGRKGPQIEQVSHLRGNLGAVCLQFGIMKVTDFAREDRFSAHC